MGDRFQREQVVALTGMRSNCWDWRNGQARRLRARYRLEGPSAFTHGNRGRRPVNAVARDVTKRVVRHNRQFTVAALDPETAWRERPRQLDQLFYFKFYTVRFASQVIDIPRPGPRYLARARVEVKHRFYALCGCPATASAWPQEYPRHTTARCD